MIGLRERGRDPASLVRGRAAARLIAVALAMALAVVACVPPADAPGPPVSRVVTIDGGDWRLLSAGEDGMRGQTDFRGADGMLFDMGAGIAPGTVSFVMDDVAIPLDIAWFAADGRFLGSDRMAPCAAEPCPRYVAPDTFRWAIEAPPGAFDGLDRDARLDVEP